MHISINKHVSGVFAYVVCTIRS